MVLHPLAQHVLVQPQILRRLADLYPALPDQPDRFKLELRTEGSPSHKTPRLHHPT
jgi:hypothetical protein